MARVGFEPRPWRSKSHRSNYSAMLPTAYFHTSMQILAYEVRFVTVHNAIILNIKFISLFALKL